MIKCIILSCTLSSEVWLYLKPKKGQPTFSRWTAHRKIMVLGCRLPISFRTLISILPYHESLPVPRIVLPHSLGWNYFRMFPQFDGFQQKVHFYLLAYRFLTSIFTSYTSQFCLSLTYHNSSDIYTTITRSGLYNPDHGKITSLRV